ncbi:MAG: glycosyltransferase family 4 protein [Candidatus Omnitrophica bacterium]|nr:glycosyltransferase family 4 protein [Candidatus Omnitrophota bacterium]
MKVGLDARILAHPQSGIATYLINLIREYRKTDQIQISLFGDKPINRCYEEAVRGLDVDIFGQNSRKRWAQFLLPSRLRGRSIDVYHAVWNNAVPLLTRVPTVVTICDLIPWKVPEVFKGLKKEMKYKAQQWCAARWAKKVITISESSKKDIVELLKIRPDKVSVTYLGSNIKRVDDPDAIDECLCHHKIRRPYILHVGDLIQPRRNIVTLLKAFSLLLERKPIDIKLVLVGSKGEEGSLYNSLMELARGLNIEKMITVTGHISRPDFNKILSGATALAFPSRYEGFGLPILEAMSCGVPVVASNASSVPEVVGDAAILVEPEDVNGFVSAISRVCTDEALRGDLIKKGKDRAEVFSWRKTAEETLRVYKEAVV